MYLCVVRLPDLAELPEVVRPELLLTNVLWYKLEAHVAHRLVLEDLGGDSVAHLLRHLQGKGKGKGGKQKKKLT